MTRRIPRSGPRLVESFLLAVAVHLIAISAQAQNTTNPFQPYAPDSDTIVLYHFDELQGSFVPDSGPHALHGTSDGTSVCEGRFGPALGFEGASEVRTMESALFQSPNFTYEAWIRPRAIGWAILFDNQTWGIPPKYGRLLGLGADNSLCAYCASGSHDPSFALCTDESIPVDEWTHVAGVFDADASTLSLWINGRLAKSLTPFVNYLGTDEVMIGHDLVDPMFYFVGDIDEARISSVARGFTPVAVEETSWGHLKALW